MKTPRVMSFKIVILGCGILFLSFWNSGLLAQELLLLKNAKVFMMGRGGVLDPGMILVRDGKIEKVSAAVEAPPGAVILDLAGRSVIPGLVCASSSILVPLRDLSFPGEETPDSNVLEGLNVYDESIPELIHQGVTAAYVTAASYQLMGGLGAVVRLAGRAPGSIEVLKEKAGLSVRVERMEENKTSNLLRLTQYQRVRDFFIQARDYRKEWQDYENKLAEYNESQKQIKEASAEDKAKDKEKDKEKAKKPEKPKRDEGKEILLQVMDQKIPLRVEAHRTDAILNALRLGQEFGFKVILERAEDWPEVLPQIQEAAAGLLSHPGLNYRKFLVPGGAKGQAANLLKLNADEFFYPDEDGEAGPTPQKREENWRGLASAKVPFALIPPDRLPLSSRYLRFYASLLVAIGVSQEDALRAVTSAPAEMLGVSDRIGSVEEGKDADLVVLMGEPLDSLSKVEMVLIKGKKVWENKNETR